MHKADFIPSNAVSLSHHFLALTEILLTESVHTLSTPLSFSFPWDFWPGLGDRFATPLGCAVLLLFLNIRSISSCHCLENLYPSYHNRPPGPLGNLIDELSFLCISNNHHCHSPSLIFQTKPLVVITTPQSK